MKKLIKMFYIGFIICEISAEGIYRVEEVAQRPRGGQFDGFKDLQVLAGFDSLNTKFIGNWPFGPSYAVAYDPLRAFVFCGSGGGVYILNVSDPSNPVKIGEIRTRGLVFGLFYHQSTQRLYIAAYAGGIEIWDVSQATNPVRLGYYFTPGYAEDVYVSGNYAYVADYDAGLRIIDVSNPSNPYQVGFYDTPGYAEDIYISCNYDK
ncbi:MAG: hypothetical protein ABDH37_06500, partial [Candidatus Hydrothermales bacterium]